MLFSSRPLAVAGSSFFCHTTLYVASEYLTSQAASDTSAVVPAKYALPMPSDVAPVYAPVPGSVR